MSKHRQTIAKPLAITPSDSTDIAKSDGIHVNGSGNVKFNDAYGNTVTLYMLAGVSYPYEATRIFATGTSATGIHALYF